MKRYNYDYPMQMNPYASNIAKKYPVEEKKPIFEPESRQMYIPKSIQRPMEEEEEYDDDDGYECDKADTQYMKSLYPDMCKNIQLHVDEECDNLEYEGSLMFDEYPDKEVILTIVARIYAKMEKDGVLPKLMQEVQPVETDVEAQQFVVPGRNVWLWDNIQVQLLNEMFGRRRRRYPRRYRSPYIPYRPRPSIAYPRRPYLPYQPYLPYVPYRYRYFY
ncbi:MAG: hypothetical protein CVU84_14070 [Firmicutes bacterium HGW-Firmicutes-1]|jgi:hypothetical protein|nr:MAG: hypothetical protein CVU84_14070 [Firmicutes bacterium HGW-Firmicutes-1]